MIRAWDGQIRLGDLMKLAMVLLLAGSSMFGRAESSGEGGGLDVQVNAADGAYSIATPGSGVVALRSGVGVEVDGRWLHAADYPRHAVKPSEGQGYLGQAAEWQVTYSGIRGEPELIYKLRSYKGKPFGDIQVTVRNTTGKPIHVEDIRSVDSREGAIVDLGGPAGEDRILSNTVNEANPDVIVRDLTNADQQMQRGVGSQLIYNRQSHHSLFLGALTADRFLTILRLHLARDSGNEPHPVAYEVDSTGITEMSNLQALKYSSAEDHVKLSLPVAPGEELSSERVLISLSSDYHEQLETYGSLIRQIHRARTSAPPLMGWWSWTAYYFGLNEGAALTNAEWEAQHLKSLGYDVFHIDEGYQYARGEYQTANATLFPHGMARLYHAVERMGLVPAIWTAPFEVSERSWVYKNHPDWLVKNANGEPIHVGYVVDKVEHIFVLDTTNPGAQAYLRKTYSIIANDWGVRYIKLDFMNYTTIEGYYYKPNTTAMEAQRIGLQIIRDTVGDKVYLDKDGSPMLNPVGIVDYGRISVDTGHSFSASKRAASGIAGRYYMNRNFFVADPDAFTVSAQTVQNYAHETNEPETLDNAQVSIALSAISGGMFEIGDDLPMLSRASERLVLVENPDLIDMIRLGKASVPIDLMSFAAEDGQPSIFFLKEDRRQSVLTVFNWTDKERPRSIELAALGLPSGDKYTITDVLEKKENSVSATGVLAFSQSPHSVRILKIIDESVHPVAPTVVTDHPSSGSTGDTLTFSAHILDDDPVLSYQWDFGDGITLENAEVTHTYTQPGEYNVHITAKCLSGLSTTDRFQLHISGHMSSRFDPQHIRPYAGTD